ncbi:MAG: hypothetical protein M1812_000517 [Candelaria pacifica]|nr:MAG: hypothetical protein M1812_000517 [Candelaria pacifica]
MSDTLTPTRGTIYCWGAPTESFLRRKREEAEPELSPASRHSLPPAKSETPLRKRKRDEGEPKLDPTSTPKDDEGKPKAKRPCPLPPRLGKERLRGPDGKFVKNETVSNAIVEAEKKAKAGEEGK